MSLKKQINLSLFFKNNICSFICSCSMHNLIIYFDMRGHCQLTQITQIFSSGALDATARGRVQVNRRGLRVCITDSPASLHPVPGGSGSDARRRSRQPPQARKKRAAERGGGGGTFRPPWQVRRPGASRQRTHPCHVGSHRRRIVGGSRRRWIAWRWIRRRAT